MAMLCVMLACGLLNIKMQTQQHIEAYIIHATWHILSHAHTT